MSYALRNTLIMGVFLVIILVVGGYVVYWYQAGVIDEKTQAENEKRRELDDLAGASEAYRTVRERLREMELKWERQDKVIPSKESPALTVAYLNDILAKGRAFVEYDFTFDRRENFDEYSTSMYTLRGRGSFANLFRFVWYLENRRRLVRIESLSLRATQEREEEGAPPRVFLEFTMKLRTYSAPKPGRERKTLVEIARAPMSLPNPFEPLIWDEVPVNVAGLINVEQASLVALTSEVVFIDDGTGRMRPLEEGDRVYLGYLYRIVPGKNQAIFRLNKGGIAETVVLTLGEEEEAVEVSPLLSRGEAPVIRREVPAAPSPARLLGAQVAEVASGTQVTLSLRGRCEYRTLILSKPDRVVIDMEPAVLGWEERRLNVGGAVIRRVRSAQFSTVPLVVRAVIDLARQADHEVVRNNDDIVVLFR